MYLCDDRNILSNKENLLKIGKLLGVEAKKCDEIPNNGWNMADMETEGGKLMQSRHIFKSFSENCLLSLSIEPNFSLTE